MPNTTTLSASILVQDVTDPANPADVANNALTDQLTALEEDASITFVLPTGVTFGGSPIVIDLAAHKPKTVYVKGDNAFQMRIGAGADDHMIRSVAAYTFDASEPASLTFATGTGITGDTTVQIILGSEHP